MSHQSITYAESRALPSPEELAGYQQIEPSLVPTIVGILVQEGQHRRQMERQLTEAQIRILTRGQWLAFVLVVMGMTVAGVLAALGHAVASVAFGTVQLIGLAAVFLGRRATQTTGLPPANAPPP